MQISIKMLDSEKDQKEAERVQQKNQAPMSEEQEGEEIEEEILKKLVFSPIPPFLYSAPFNSVMPFPVRSPPPPPLLGG